MCRERHEAAATLSHYPRGTSPDSPYQLGGAGRVRRDYGLAAPARCKTAVLRRREIEVTGGACVPSDCCPPAFSGVQEAKRPGQSHFICWGRGSVARAAWVHEARGRVSVDKWSAASYGEASRATRTYRESVA